MIRRIVDVPGHPSAVGPYSSAVVANGFVFTSGQVPAGADGTAPADLEGQVRQCLANLDAVLREAGSRLDLVVKVNAYLTDPGQRETFNRVYADVFGNALPARTTVCVDIWDIALEVECVAVVAGEEA